MIFSRRDFNMVMIMLAVVLVGLTYLITEPMITQWRQVNQVRDRLEQQRAVAERMLNTRPEWQEKLDVLRGTLPGYGANEAVVAELLRQVRRLADESRVVTTRITPDSEKSIGDLHELAVELAWEADLEALVRFLYAVQVAGATLDIRQMTIAPFQGDRLKGNIKIFFAFKRGEAGAASGSGGT
ncbi:MAG TPA: hypothetical protein PJ991_07345 [Kiritimatiellia bacterium]|nr:hypothetical protein [Kiritimatiellia bacterium]